MAGSVDKKTTSPRHRELRHFLTSRRARVSPEQAGLPNGSSRRRTPGLRREEVAVLAGVSVSWYQWLEQGRDITVSPQILDAISQVLALTGDERRHLYALAGLNPPARRPAQGTDHLRDGLQRLIDSWEPNPAHILDPYWNVVAHNQAWRRVVATSPRWSRNCLVNMFMDPDARTLYPDWEHEAAALVALYHGLMSERPDDQGYHAIIDELAAMSHEFRDLWANGEVIAGGQTTSLLNHPQAGALHLEVTQLTVPARPDLTIFVHNPIPDTGTDRKLTELATLQRAPGGRGRSMVG